MKRSVAKAPLVVGPDEVDASPCAAARAARVHHKLLILRRRLHLMSHRSFYRQMAKRNRRRANPPPVPDSPNHLIFERYMLLKRNDVEEWAISPILNGQLNVQSAISEVRTVDVEHRSRELLRLHGLMEGRFVDGPEHVTCIFSIQAEHFNSA